MNKEFIPYEQALALKELGFDEQCICAYFHPNVESIKYPKFHYCNSILLMGEGTCTAPLYQQTFRWFREKYGLFGCIDLMICYPSHWFIRIDKIEINDYLYQSEDENIQYSTYEEAELACLKKLIEIVKNK